MSEPESPSTLIGSRNVSIDRLVSCLPRSLSCAALASIGLVTAAAAAGAQTERHTISGGRTAIYNLAGKVRVQAGSGSQVVVDLTRGGHDAGKLRVETGNVRGENALRVIYPDDRVVYPELRYHSSSDVRVDDDGTFDHGDWRGGRHVTIRDGGSGLEAYADLTVSVPRGQRIDLHLAVGEATVSNVDGDLKVSVGSGRATSEHTRGRLSIETGSGSAEVTDAQGDVTLDTGSGGLTINGVHGDNLSMNTGSGGVRGGDVDVKTLKVDVGSGGVRLDRIKTATAKIEAGSGSVDVAFTATVSSFDGEAGSGGMTIRLPASQTGTVDLDAGSGGIRSDFEVSTSRFQRDHVRGQIGNGGNARIRIETGSGGIRLLKN